MRSLLEIGCEELPVGFLKNIQRDIPKVIEKIAKKNHITIDEPCLYLTPRRIVLILNGITQTKKELHEEFRGPKESIAYKDGEPTRALEGFLKGKGCTLEDISVKDGYIYVVKNTILPEIDELISEIYMTIFNDLRLPRSMFWKNKKNRFVRPVRWILSLIDNKTIDIELFGISSQNKTITGSRSSEKYVEVNNIDEYLKTLKDNDIVLDQNQRFESIKKGISDLNAEWDEALGWENTYLVERINIFREDINKDFMELPPQVIRMVMKKHQRYFPCSSNGKLDPQFVALSNTPVTDSIRDGHKRVLSTRLSDANFFFKEDLKKGMDSFIPGLKNMVFHHKIGDLFQKSERIGIIAEYIKYNYFSDLSCDKDIKELSKYIKADIMSEMVYEFPELQGVMGSIYLQKEFYSKESSAFCEEHYKPLGPDDSLPVSKLGIIFALADKIDTIVSFFAAGIKPTGSKDPFALRRMSLGFLRILIDKDISLDLDKIIDKCMDALTKQGFSYDTPKKDVMDFLKDRFYFLLKGDYTPDIIESVCSTGFTIPSDSYKKIDALSSLSKAKEFRSFSLLALRINNILKDYEDDDIRPSKELFEHEQENTLLDIFDEKAHELNDYFCKGDYNSSYGMMIELYKPIDDFFENVMVNCEDEEKKKNRKRLLFLFQKLFYRLLDIEKIADKSERS